MSHWYDGKTGEPRYEVPKAKGGGMRPSTIADAREHGWVPSVTGICDIIAKGNLQNWIVDQHLKAAFNNPPGTTEIYDNWKERILPIANQRRDESADLGSVVHDGIEKWLTNQPVEDVRGLLYVKTVKKWFDENVDLSKEHKSEFYITTPEGYGGRCDFSGYDRENKHVIVDFKTQGAEDGKDFNFYPSWGWQLAAYDAANDSVKNLGKRISVVLSTKNPERLETKEWDFEENWEDFKSCFRMWKRMNDWTS